MFLRIIIIVLISYFLLRIIKNWLFSASKQPQVKEKAPGKDENIQQKYADKIEDADFEELE